MIKKISVFLVVMFCLISTTTFAVQVTPVLAIFVPAGNGDYQSCFAWEYQDGTHKALVKCPLPANQGTAVFASYNNVPQGNITSGADAAYIDFHPSPLALYLPPFTSFNNFVTSLILSDNQNGPATIAIKDPNSASCLIMENVTDNLTLTIPAGAPGVWFTHPSNVSN